MKSKILFIIFLVISKTGYTDSEINTSNNILNIDGDITATTIGNSTSNGLIIDQGGYARNKSNAVNIISINKGIGRHNPCNSISPPPPSWCVTGRGVVGNVIDQQ
jgi:hypothetical protein